MADFTDVLVAEEVFLDGMDSPNAEVFRMSEGIPVPPVTPDTTPPQVGNFDPAVGTEILSSQSISFDVTDDSGAFARIFVAALFAATGQQELIHDGDAFVGFYSPNSSRVPIANGYRYTVTRAGGWESTPTIRVFPIDSSGNE